MEIYKKMLCFLLFVSIMSGKCFATNEWESTKLVWNLGIATICDKGNFKAPIEYFASEPVFDFYCYEQIQSGDIVWVQPHLIHEFTSKILPHLSVPFILVINDGDASFPSDCLQQTELSNLLNNEYLIQIFAQNCDYNGSSNKISPIPIGIDFHTVSYKSEHGGWGMKGSPKQQEDYLMHQFQTALPTSQRKCRAFIDFQHSDTMHGSFKRHLQFGEDRSSIFQYLIHSNVVDYGPWLSRGQLWSTKKEYAFSISPHGNGLDTHRTWEDLALGCIVIVKTSSLDPLYEGLPVVIIKDWDEINEENFRLWLTQYGDVSSNPSYRQKLSSSYWMNRIKQMSHLYKNHE